MNSTKPWNNKGMISYPVNHINKSSIGFKNKKPSISFKISNYFNRFFKKSTNPIVKKELEILRDET